MTERQEAQVAPGSPGDPSPEAAAPTPAGPDVPPEGRGAPEASLAPVDPRSSPSRLADHAAIERLASDLLPALVARLSGTGLGELEVREGEWRVRLRRPSAADRRPVERSGRAVRGTGRDGHRAATSADHAHASAGHEEAPAGRHTPLVATSPAVGVYRARAEIRSGTRVRAGERLGVVDLLGVPQEVVAGADGVVAALFVEDGDAVEYGQALLALEPAATPEHEAAPQAVPVG